MLTANILGALDWTELVYAAFGSFIGIFVPLFIEKRVAKRQAKHDREVVLHSLEKELAAVLNLIELHENDPSREFCVFHFSTFIWDSISSSHVLPEMLADDQEHCRRLIDIYSKLAVLKSYHEKFESAIQISDAQTREMWNGLVWQESCALRRTIGANILEYLTVDSQKTR